MHDHPLYPPTQRIPTQLVGPQTSFPSPQTHSSRLDLKRFLCFWYSDEEGVRGRQQGERVWVWELEPEEMSKMCLREVGVYLHHFLC